jgi:hypothetical protein
MVKIMFNKYDKKIMRKLQKRMKGKENSWQQIYKEVFLVYRKNWLTIIILSVIALILINLIVIILIYSIIKGDLK